MNVSLSLLIIYDGNISADGKLFHHSMTAHYDQFSAIMKNERET